MRDSSVIALLVGSGLRWIAPPKRAFLTAAQGPGPSLFQIHSLLCLSPAAAELSFWPSGMHPVQAVSSFTSALSKSHWNMLSVGIIFFFHMILGARAIVTVLISDSPTRPVPCWKASAGIRGKD